jgi:ubiquinone/menaquinone biosynthesis C-methylase UbiE
MAGLGLVVVWALASFVMVRFGFDMNGRAALPTEAFLRSGTGKVLDMGAGTGRSTLMVLEARPQATVVALDSFADSYVQHFGVRNAGAVVDQGRERLLANMRAAGVDQRVSVQPGDMRRMPLESDSFDAALSAYAIDHLGPQGIREALSEAHRVLKPHGEFLLIVVNQDGWLNFTFGPLMMHSRMVPGNATSATPVSKSWRAEPNRPPNMCWPARPDLPGNASVVGQALSPANGPPGHAR